ncbi:AAA domain-containing protein [Bacillus sp. P1(2020)]|uniref:AAA domain-containing protein n=1 Tax=Pallidibacillus pasinlerensis TaxID=2703818 RepID=A0ABX0A101_9BACI|nr:AAA family ATPase [Pallidibacillus pasinlerensis]NCU17021.1 AAA domain-containing protein [Pallidibacillus pasinlerensis]
MVHINEALTKMKQEMERIIVGKDELVELFTIALLVNGHILLESVPGTGKTTFAKTFSQLIAGEFKRIQFTPDVLPSDVTGIQFFNPKTQEFELREGPIMTNILLADEINRATPRTQSSLLEVMEELQVTIDGETIKVEPPFMVIATQNPVESRQGTFPLPAAQMDRFFMKVDIGYPSVEEEKKMLRYNRETLAKPTVEPVLTKEDIVKLQKALNEVQIIEDVEDYLLSIIRLTS